MLLRNICFSIIFAMILSSCISINISDPMGKQYNEVVLEGSGPYKIALFSINGMISDAPQKGFLSSGPGMIQDFLTQLKLAENDPMVKAVLVKINSPGGTVTSSDIIYNELINFKKRSGKKVVICMMDMAASGGYYISLAGDYIIANPTTITGSVGVIFMRPEISTLTSKIGISMEINKSGKNKDMGSPYRESTKEEDELFNNLINNLADRFYRLLTENRNITKEALEEIKTARIFVSDEAKRLGLIDEIAYLNDSIYKTMDLVNIARDSKVIAYRPSRQYYDNIYNTPGAAADYSRQIDLGPINSLLEIKTGFYYLWEPGLN